VINVDERIFARVVDEGGGCFTLKVDSPEEVVRFREILSSPCGLDVVYEDLEPVVIEDDYPQEVAEVSGLCCPLEPDRSWDDSVCKLVTGLDEAAIELIREAIANVGGN